MASGLIWDALAEPPAWPAAAGARCRITYIRIAELAARMLSDGSTTFSIVPITGLTEIPI